MTDEARRAEAYSLLTCLSEFITHDGEWDTREEAIDYLLHYQDRSIAQAAKERDEQFQELLRESCEEYADFAKALGLPEKISEHEVPGYYHILAAIKQQAKETARLREALLIVMNSWEIEFGRNRPFPQWWIVALRALEPCGACAEGMVQASNHTCDINGDG